MGYLRKWFRPVRGVIRSKAMFVISPLRVTPSITPACVGAGVIFYEGHGILFARYNLN